MGRDVTGLVLRQPRQPRVLLLEVQHRQRDRHDRGKHDHAERPVHRQQDRRHHRDLQPVEDQEHQPEGHEAANRAEVVHDSRQQLPGLPAAVEAHRQDLQLRVQVLADVGLDAHGGAGDQPASDEPQHGLGDAHAHRRGAKHPQPVLVLLAHRAVDHGLGHQRNGHGGTEAGDRDHDHGDPPHPVRHQVRHHPPQVGADPLAGRRRRYRRRRAQRVTYGFNHLVDLPMPGKSLTRDVMRRRPRAGCRTASRTARRSDRHGPAVPRACRVRRRGRPRRRGSGRPRARSTAGGR